ncbi:MAG: HEAT repeat domain-containing protein, partial [Prolixibacteraceae bacterium]
PADCSVEVNEEKLDAAFGLMEKGYKKEAQSIFEELVKTGGLPAQTAALNGLFEMSSEKAEFIRNQLEKYDEPELRSEIIRLVIKLPEEYKKGNEFFETRDLSNSEKIQLLSILGDRKDNSIHDVVTGYLKDENEAIRLAALRVIPSTGSAEDILLLAEIAAKSRGGEKQLAQNALYTIPGKEVNKKIISLLSSAPPEVKTELIQAAGGRNMTEASGELFKLAESESRQVKNEAIKALGKVADDSALKQLTGLLSNADSPRERKALEDAVYLVASRNTDVSESSEVLVKELKKADNSEHVSSLLSILGQIGNPEDYEIIREYFSHTDKEMQTAAIRAVAEWPTTQPLDDLHKFLNDKSDARQHALAMKSYLQIVESNGELNSEEKIEKLNTAYDLSENLVEKRMIISGYSKISEPGSLGKLAEIMEVPETRREVEMAILELAPEIWEQDELVIAQLEKVMVLSDNESFIKRVAEEIKKRSE